MMKFNIIIEEITEIKIDISKKEKFFNYVRGWDKKEITRGKGNSITLSVKIPLDIKIFIIGHSVYEEYTGRKVLADFKTIENLKVMFNNPEFLNSLDNVSYWRKWHEDVKKLNVKDFGISINIQDLKIKNKPTSSQQRMIDFRKEVLEQLKSELQKKNIKLNDKEERFNLFDGKKIKGYLITSSKLIFDYFIKIKFDAIREVAHIDLYEKSTGKYAYGFPSMTNFIYDIDKIIKMERNLDLSKFKKVN